ncbi:uncharacterized protein LOC105690872 [Athalia rosae]|uniref:uncharacterized protein LOC105690872 n=1 Tax=Athalia rosae TaxID=37344 RepID=UPI002033E35F|nr:uncharacterized protein LOC105690872 [Athalia rosae]
MSSYKLTYFDFTGLGEPIRYMLSYAGIKFEDFRITLEEWPKHKHQMPMEQLPVLEIDGKEYHQSMPLGRFLAKKSNVYSTDDLEALQIDAAVSCINDLRQALANYFWSDEPERKEKLKAEAEKRLTFFLGKFESWLQSNGGHFVGNKVTWADINYVSLHDYFCAMLERDIVEGYPNLKKLVNEINSIPNIKAYLEKRPKTRFDDVQGLPYSIIINTSHWLKILITIDQPSEYQSPIETHRFERRKFFKMSTYKLTYFNFTGLGEPIRFLLNYGGVDFEDIRLEKDNFPAVKSQFPLQQLPVLEIDGKVYCQSMAIIRLLAKKFNLFGSDPFETYEIDAALETITDVRMTLMFWLRTTDEAAKAAQENEILQKAAVYLRKLDSGVKNGHLAGGKLSAADIVWASYSPMFNYYFAKFINDEYSNLKKVVATVEALPSIKSYLAKRPKTEF